MKNNKEVLMKKKPMGDEGCPKSSQVHAVPDIEVEDYRANVRIAEAFDAFGSDGSTPDFLGNTISSLRLLKSQARAPMLFSAGANFGQYAAICSAEDGILLTRPQESAARAFSTILFYLATQSPMT